MTTRNEINPAKKLAPQQKRSREARERILLAAEELLRHEGVDGFSMAAVARVAGLPVGNIYRRFEGRDDLLTALKEIVASRIISAVAEAVQCREHEDLRGFVMTFARAIGEVFSRDEALHRALFDPRVASPAMLVTGVSTKTANFRLFHDGVSKYTENSPAEEVLLSSKVAFSVIVNAPLQKLRGVDVLLSGMEWDVIISQFGTAAFLYLEAALPKSA
jgi:AcrR family transcriptional regulator